MKAIDQYHIMNTTTEKIKKWVSSVRGKILGKERRPVYRTIPDVINHYDYKTDIQMQPMPIEEVLIIEIPVKELENISDVQDWYRRNLGGFAPYKFNKMIMDHFHEKHLRETDIRLKDLYDKYKVMLALISDRKYNGL